MAYCSPPWASTSLRGDRYAQTFTDPLLNVVMVYSSRGLLPPGVWLDAVTGNGSTPESVRPMSGMRIQVTPLLLTARVYSSACIETQPFDSTKPRRSRRDTSGFWTTACTTTLLPSGPVTVIGTSVVPLST